MYNKSYSFNVLYISDVSVTHEFYKSIGAEISQLESDKVVVHLGDFKLHFVLESTEPFEEYQFATTKSGRGQGNLFYIETNNIEKLYEVIKASSAIVKSAIKDNLWSGREFIFEDPDGYKFVIYQML